MSLTWQALARFPLAEAAEKHYPKSCTLREHSADTFFRCEMNELISLESLEWRVTVFTLLDCCRLMVERYALFSSVERKNLNGERETKPFNCRGASGFMLAKRKRFGNEREEEQPKNFGIFRTIKNHRNGFTHNIIKVEKELADRCNRADDRINGFIVGF